MSLFTKLLLWFIATVILAVSGFAVVQRFFGDEPSQYGPLPGRVVAHFAEQAERAMRKSPQDLREYLANLKADTGIEAVFVDATGLDHLDRGDHTEMFGRLQRSRFFATVHRGRLIVGRPTRSGAGVLLAATPRFMDQHAFLVRPHLWWLATVLILTYLLARHLTQPLRALQVVARRLGQGDLRARAADDRKDEFGQLARTINQMAERMEMLVESERRLLRDVSHELRSPLARLGVAVELARTSDNPARELDLIEKQATRLNELVGTLLEVARAESAPHALQREPVALKPVLEDLAAEARLEAGSKRILLEAQEITVPADAELLRRAVENVLRNAVRYTRDDGTVSVRLARAAHAAEVTIRDEGPGVPEELLPRLFEPFFRVEGQHGTGFGLGLSIARRAMAAHGGSIRARNTQPGLEVTLSIPFE